MGGPPLALASLLIVAAQGAPSLPAASGQPFATSDLTTLVAAIEARADGVKGQCVARPHGPERVTLLCLPNGLTIDEAGSDGAAAGEEAVAERSIEADDAGSEAGAEPPSSAAEPHADAEPAATDDAPPSTDILLRKGKPGDGEATRTLTAMTRDEVEAFCRKSDPTCAVRATAIAGASGFTSVYLNGGVAVTILWRGNDQLILRSLITPGAAGNAWHETRVRKLAPLIIDGATPAS